MSTKSAKETVTVTFRTDVPDAQVPVYFNAFTLCHLEEEGTFVTLWHLPPRLATRDATPLFHARIDHADLKRIYEDNFESYLGAIGAPTPDSGKSRLSNEIHPAPHVCVAVLNAARVGENAEIVFSSLSIREVQAVIRAELGVEKPRLWTAGRFVSTFSVHRRLVFALFETLAENASPKASKK